MDCKKLTLSREDCLETKDHHVHLFVMDAGIIWTMGGRRNNPTRKRRERNPAWSCSLLGGRLRRHWELHLLRPRHPLWKCRESCRSFRLHDHVGVRAPDAEICGGDTSVPPGRWRRHGSGPGHESLGRRPRRHVHPRRLFSHGCYQLPFGNTISQRCHSSDCTLCPHGYNWNYCPTRYSQLVWYQCKREGESGRSYCCVSQRHSSSSHGLYASLHSSVPFSLLQDVCEPCTYTRHHPDRIRRFLSCLFGPRKHFPTRSRDANS